MGKVAVNQDTDVHADVESNGHFVPVDFAPLEVPAEYVEMLDAGETKMLVKLQDRIRATEAEYAQASEQMKAISQQVEQMERQQIMRSGKVGGDIEMIKEIVNDARLRNVIEEADTAPDDES